MVKKYSRKSKSRSKSGKRRQYRRSKKRQYRRRKTSPLLQIGNVKSPTLVKSSPGFVRRHKKKLIGALGIGGAIAVAYAGGLTVGDLTSLFNKSKSYIESAIYASKVKEGPMNMAKALRGL